MQSAFWTASGKLLIMQGKSVGKASKVQATPECSEESLHGLCLKRQGIHLLLFATDKLTRTACGCTHVIHTVYTCEAGQWSLDGSLEVP